MTRPFPRLGPEVLRNGHTRFRVWAPAAEKSVELVWTEPEQAQRIAPMTRRASGTWDVTVDGAPEGTGYAFRIDEDPARVWPDPFGYEELRAGDVDGPSRVVDLAAIVASPGRPPGPIVTAEGLAAGGVLEVHVASEVPRGPAGADGTFALLAEGRLDEAAALGLAGVELMPVAIAAGRFDWGYNGINPGSVRSDLGGWAGLVRLIDAAHLRGLAVGLDVVGNHVGPDGGYIHAFGPFAAGRGPWGDTPDFEQPAVRAWWLQSVGRLAAAGADYLRLDAVQGMYWHKQPKRPHILVETARYLHELAGAGRIARAPLLVAEAGSEWVAEHKDMLLAPVADGGAGLAGFWDDELRHALFLWAYRVPLDPGELAGLGMAGYLPRVAAMIRGDDRPEETTPIEAADVARMAAAPAVGADVLAGQGHWRAWRNHDQTGNHLLGIEPGLQGLLLALHRLGLTPGKAQTVVEAVIDGSTVVPDVKLPADMALAAGAEVERAEALDRATFAFMWSQPGTPYDFDRAQFPYAHGSAKPEIVEGTVKGRAHEFGFDERHALAHDDPDELRMPLPHDPATYVLACRGPRDMRPERALLLADLVARRRGLDVDATPSAAAVGGGDGVLTVLGEGAATRVAVVNRATSSIEVDLAEHVPAGTGPWRVVLDTGAAVYGGDGQTPARVAGDRLVLPPATMVQLAPALPQ